MLKREPQLHSTYHNRMLHQTSVELYARFAWTMFPFVEPFLLTETQRRLMLRVPRPGGSEPFDAEEREKYITTATKRRSGSEKEA
jgi:hypothetical protein